MSKRDTIIISVLVNAGLLVVLFFTAVTSRDEVIGGATSAIASKIYEEEKSPIVQMPKEAPKKVAELAKVEKPLVTLPVKEEKKEAPLPVMEKELVHKLPPLATDDVAAEKREEKNEFFEHIVKSGESVEKIARRYSLRLAELREMNNLKDNFLRIGQKLIVKQGEKKKPQAEFLDPNGEYYIVKTGDSPWTIAMKNHIKVDDLLKLNELNEQKARKLKPGDKLRIR